ncbi:MAG: ferritin family protein [Flavitalea sp.]
MNKSVQQALERGFIRETQAHLKYMIFAQQAEVEAKTAPEKEKVLLLEAAALFHRIARDEAGHAQSYLKGLGEIGKTPQNLQTAVEMELNDGVEYGISAAAARAEGMDEIAKIFERIAENEKLHVELYRQLAEGIQDIWLDDRLKSVGLHDSGK